MAPISSLKTVQTIGRGAAKTLDALIVGYGNMGSAFAAGLKKAKIANITAVSPTAREIDGIRFCQNPEEIKGLKFDVIIGGVKPQIFKDVFMRGDFCNNLKSHGAVISLAAGLSLETLEECFNPNTAIVRAMPNLPAKIGLSVTGAVANQHASDEQLQLAHEILSAVGEVVWVKDEKAINAITAASGSGPGYMFEIMRQFSTAIKTLSDTNELGFSDEDIRALVINTMEGSARLAKQDSSKSFEELRNAVTSKGGTTAAGLQKLSEGNQIGSLLTNTVQAAFDRAIELAKIAATTTPSAPSKDIEKPSSAQQLSNAAEKEAQSR